jgi:Ca2+-binding RTX toxin-like protein
MAAASDSKTGGNGNDRAVSGLFVDIMDGGSGNDNLNSVDLVVNNDSLDGGFWHRHLP